MHLRKRRGQALVEFAVAVPVLLLVLGGIIDGGWLFNTQLMLTNASREGARVGALGLDDATVQQSVEDYLTNAGFSETPTITVDQTGGMSRVELEAEIPLIFGTFGPSMTLGGETVMRRE